MEIDLSRGEQGQFINGGFSQFKDGHRAILFCVIVNRGGSKDPFSKNSIAPNKKRTTLK